MTRYDVGVLLLRLIVGVTLILHAYNHLFGGGRLPGAGRWFASMGLRNGLLQARMSVLFEVLAGGGLIVGLLTPLAASAAIGVMTVAAVIAHRPNGFFIFRDGYEYVLMISVVALAVAILGPGRLSLDHAAGITFDGWVGGLVAGALGLGGAVVLLATSWRPPKKGPPKEAPKPASDSADATT